MAKQTKPIHPDFDTEKLLVGGPAFEALLSKVDVTKQFNGLKEEFKNTKSTSKKDIIVKKLKYLEGLRRAELKPQNAYILHNVPIIPPLARPTMIMGNNEIKYADVSNLYKDHMLVNNGLKGTVNDLTPDQLVDERRDMYNGVKAIFGLGDAIAGASRGKNLKGYIRQISGTSGPKGGFFHSKILSKKLDFSGRATIYAEPNLGFNEAGVPVDMLWTTYEFHIIRDLVKSGYDYISAKKAVVDRSPAATASFNKLIKEIPVILNRAPTLMKSNIMAFMPVPVKEKSIAFSPLSLSFMAADYDGDSISVQVPMTQEAILEAKTKLLPQYQIYDHRKGLGNSMSTPQHEAIIGSVYMTDPDTSQKVVTFSSEEEVLTALKAGTIRENTPIMIKK